MPKFLFFIFLLFWICWLLRRAVLARIKPADTLKKTDQHQSKPIEKMVSCAHCALNQPLSESFLVCGNYYCCEEHAKEALI